MLRRLTLLLTLMQMGMLAVATGGSSGCLQRLEPESTPIPAKLQLKLRLRQSCPFDTRDYDTTCLAAIAVVVRQGDTVLSQNCTVLDNRPSDLQRLLFDGPRMSFGSLTSEGTVTFEVRGLHDRSLPQPDAGVASLCGQTGEDFSHWLLFGESAPIDLTKLEQEDAGVVVHFVEIDCRDCDEGCRDLGQTTCPTSPISFCVPGAVNLRCDQPCEADEQCFDGLLSCDLDNNVCDQSTARLGQFCDACDSDEQCRAELGYFCVSLDGDPPGICAQRCPQEMCSGGMKCNRLGNRLRRVTAGTMPDGGS